MTWSTSPSVGTVSSTGLYTAPSTIASQQVVTVTATSVADPTKSASASVTLIPPDFSISASPGSQSVVQGGGTSYVASISPSNGFNAAVTFSVSGLPAGAAGTFSPASVTGSGTTTLNVTTSGSTPVGTYTVTITGTSGTLVHTTTATLFVGAPGSSFNPIRINSGGPAFTGSQGLIWSADTGFTGGSTGSIPSSTAIANTVDDTLYQTERYGAFTYTLTVPAGNYQVTLKFAETYFTSGAASGQRVFNVAINGTTVLTNFDIKAAAGGANIAVDRTFTTTAAATSNNLQIQFIHLATQADLPKVDAIEVIAALNSPTITTQPASKTVTEGQTAAFTVAASGTAPIGYQWRKGGVNIAGATSSTYTTPATVLADSGATFDVVLSNVAGTVTSTPATLTVSPLAVSALGVNPASVAGVGSSIGTVTLSGPAPAAGTVVQLTSSNTSAATVPGTVTVAAGATSATFTANTLTVAAATSVTISATYQGTTKTATLTVNPPLSVQSVTLNPSTVTSGATSTGTVTLSGPAPAGGTTVQLASNNTSAATVPGTVTVAASSSTATFTVNTSAVSSVTSVTISATYQGTKTATLTVNPAPSVQSVTLSPGSVTGGATSTGTVTLSAPAPAGGMTVQLASNNTSAATVPGTVTVAASSSTATFTVNTGAVAGLTSVTITATLNGSATATLTVNPAPSFNPIRVNSAGGAFTDSQGFIWSADTGFTGGNTASVSSAIANTVDDALYQTERYGALTYAFTVPAGGYQVTLKFAETYYTSGAASGQRVFNVAINGTTVLNNFDIKAAAGGANIAVDRTFTVMAGAGSNNLQIQLIHLATQPDLPKVNAIEIISSGVTGVTITTQPASQAVTEGQTATFTVAASGSAPISYQWRKGGVNIAGATSPSYTTPATVLADSGATFDVVVSNAAGGVPSNAATLTVNPLTVSAVSVSPASVTGGTSSTGTVTLSGPAPAAGTVVQLASNNTSAATVPGTVTVQSGATSATFAVNTSAVGSVTSVTISATYQGTTKTTTLAVNPVLSVQSVTLNPGTVTSGTTSIGTVTLNGPAPAGGTTVQLASSNTSAATVPGTVTVAASATSATFTVSTQTVAAATSVTVTATLNGSANATLTVNPVLSVQSVTLNPSTVTSGATSTGTVTLSGPAPAGGTTVQLASNNTSAATVPGTVTVAASSSTATFTVNTSAVSSATSVTITATLNGSATATLTVNPAPSFNPIRVNSAGGAFTDSLGRVWSADTGFTGGNTATLANSIANTVDDPLYQTERYGAFTYTFTVPAGNYQVTLKFAELFYTSGASSGQRVFNVAINGATVLNNFDIKAAAGGANLAVDRTFAVTAGAGSNNLQIQFIHLTNQADLPKIDAIEIVAGN